MSVENFFVGRRRSSSGAGVGPRGYRHLSAWAVSVSEAGAWLRFGCWRREGPGRNPASKFTGHLLPPGEAANPGTRSRSSWRPMLEAGPGARLGDRGARRRLVTDRGGVRGGDLSAGNPLGQRADNAARSARQRSRWQDGDHLAGRQEFGRGVPSGERGRGAIRTSSRACRRAERGVGVRARL